jgi:large subunit ribosomal protein L28
MSKICQITKKKPMKGYNVSHSNNKTKRVFNVNLFKKKIYLPSLNKWLRVKVSAKGLKMINKLGMDKLIKQIAIYGKKK